LNLLAASISPKTTRLDRVVHVHVHGQVILVHAGRDRLHYGRVFENDAIYLWDSSIARISFPRILSFGPDALSGQPDRARWFATIPIGSALISMDRVARYQIEQGHFRATG